MKNYKQPGDRITIPAPSGGVTSGEGYLLGGFFGVATDTKNETEPVPFQLTGVVSLDKTAAQVWVVGEDIWWDDGAKEANNVAGIMKIGAVAVAAADENATGEVRLDGISSPAPVATSSLADGAVTFVKTSMFVSTEQTGTGAPQNVAHGLGVTPAAVLIVPTDTAPATTGDYTAVEGAHDVTNVIVTVTASKLFKVWAMA